MCYRWLGICMREMRQWKLNCTGFWSRGDFSPLRREGGGDRMAMIIFLGKVERERLLRKRGDGWQGWIVIRVGHGLDATTDWIGTGPDFQETLSTWLDWVSEKGPMSNSDYDMRGEDWANFCSLVTICFTNEWLSCSQPYVTVHLQLVSLRWRCHAPITGQGTHLSRVDHWVRVSQSPDAWPVQSDFRLPSRAQSIANLWPVPSSTAWWQKSYSSYVPFEPRQYRHHRHHHHHHFAGKNFLNVTN